MSQCLLIRCLGNIFFEGVSVKRFRLQWRHAVKDALSGLRVPWRSKGFLGFPSFSFVFVDVSLVSLVFEPLASLLSVLMARFVLYTGSQY